MRGAGECGANSLFSFYIAYKVIIVLFRNVYDMLQRKLVIVWLEVANTEMSVLMSVKR